MEAFFEWDSLKLLLHESTSLLPTEFIAYSRFMAITVKRNLVSSDRYEMLSPRFWHA